MRDVPRSHADVGAGPTRDMAPVPRERPYANLAPTPGRFCMRPGRHVLEMRHLGRSPGKRVVVRIEPDETTRGVVAPDG